MLDKTDKQRPLSFQDGLASFVRSLEGRNRSPHTIRSYATDISQFLSFLRATDITVHSPADVTRSHVSEFLASLGGEGVLGLTRARKLAAIREYFRFLVREHTLPHSPTEGIQTPKKERHRRTYLLPSEYNRLLSLAGANTRDYAILQVFLQTGVRLSELVGLTLDDVDFERKRVLVHGKGQAERSIELEKRGMQAVKNYLGVRPPSLSDQLFLNYQGDPISTRGIQKILVKYQRLAGITRSITPHVLRHTFATYKAERGVSLRQVQEWLGHESIATTQIYVHLIRQNSQKVMEQTRL